MSYFTIDHGGGDNYSVIAKTLCKRYNCKVEVHPADCRHRQNEFLCFERANGAFTLNASKCVTDFLINDIAGESPLRRAFISAYIAAVRRFPQALNVKAFVMEKPIDNADSMLIYPANKKVKLFNFQNKTITNVLKEGYGRAWFDKEVQVRTSPAWSFIPTLSVNPDGSYTEAVLDGIPLARTKKSKSVFEKLDSCLARMQMRDRSLIDSEEYADKLSNDLEICLERLSASVLTEQIKTCRRVNETLINAVKSQKSLKIPLCFSHGDLQQGNILYDSATNKLWIIDWETCAVRSLWYDVFILYYGMRDILNIVQTVRIGNREKWINAKKYVSAAIIFEPKTLIPIFLLEDAVWHLQQTVLLPAKNHHDSVTKNFEKIVQSWQAYQKAQ